MSRIGLSAAALAALVAFAPSGASAEIACRCAYRPLDALLCENALTARIKVTSKKRTKSGVYYVAQVRELYRGEASRSIEVEVPSGCGHELRVGRTYAVSLNVNPETGRYSTFACSTFVREWNELSADEFHSLLEPSCAPSCDDVVCEDGQVCQLEQVYCITAPCPAIPSCVPQTASEGDICYRFSETDPAQSVDRPCAEGLKCMDTNPRFGFNSALYCEVETYCLSDNTAENDCQNLAHISVPGAWGCEQNSCVWRAAE